MTEEHERLVEELAGYALGALDARDRARVETHVATCARCAQRLEEYRAIVGVLAVGLEPVAPPPAAWAAIRAGAAARSLRGRRWARLRAVRWPAVAAVVVSLLVWNVLLQRELGRQAPGPDPGPDVEALARRPGRVVILTGTGAPEASARLFVAADGGHGHLAITGVSPLPAGRTYQLWFERVGAPPLTGGAFRVAARGLAWVSVAVPVPLQEVRAIAVTEEPAPGSAVPTGPHLLDARP